MDPTTSHFIKAVTLKDWWLTKADNNSLRNTVAVAGIESEGLQVARVFYSAPIVQRLDLFTLKTAEGILVVLDGFINREQTCENGFSEEVFKHFLIGFPTNWEQSAEKCLRQGVRSNATVDKAQEATIELQDDQNIDSVEERSFRDTQSNTQNHNKDRQCCHDGDACLNTNLHDSDAGFREEGVRYSLRSRKVPYVEVEKVKNVAKSKSFSKKTATGAGASTTPSLQNIVTTRPLLKKTGENTDTCDRRIVVVLNNLAKSVVTAAEGNNTENHNVRDEDESVHTLDHLTSASVNSKKQSIREDSTLVGTNGDFSTHDAHKLENSASKKEIKQRGNLTRTNADNKNCHDSPRPSWACTSKAKSKSKAVASRVEPKASQGSTPKMQARRKLYNAEKTTCTAEGENETPTPQSSVVRTSRSGRLLLPTMEFWRNQLPIYDKDHAISGIREGSAILKFERGGKSSTEK